MGQGHRSFEIYEKALQTEMRRASTIQEEFSVMRRRALAAEARVKQLEAQLRRQEKKKPAS